MIIECQGQNNKDYFYIENISGLDELKKYVDDHIPLKCLHLSEKDLRSVFIKDYTKTMYLYLNNYLHYTDVSNDYYLLSQKDINQIETTQCNNCAGREWFGCDKYYWG